MDKLVSIIVPVYNTERFLSKCIDSLLNQTYKNIEIILIDDGSKDNSIDICRKMAEQDNRILLLHQENQGVAQARLNAFNSSKGEYITFVDSDDYVLPTYVENMINHLEREQVDMVSCQHCDAFEDKQRKTIRPIEGRMDKQSIKDLLRDKYLFDSQIRKTGITVYLCTKLIKREFVLEALKSGLGLWYGEDQVGVTHLLYNVNSIYISQNYDYFYVMHPNQASQKYREDWFLAQKQCWQKMIDIDTEGLLLKSQLPKRMLLNINRFLFTKKIYNLHGYRQFKDEISKIRDEKLLEILFDKPCFHITKKIDFVFYTLKKRYYRALYMFLLVKKVF